MDDLRKLTDEALALPQGRDQIEALRRVVDLASSLGDLDVEFEARLGILQATYYTKDVLTGLAEFGWLTTRMREHPGRWDRFDFLIDWTHKWMPTFAVQDPRVPLSRLSGLVDRVEERHDATGAGHRQAIAERLRLRLATGVGPDLAPLLADWRSSARTSLSDCALCEAALEVEVLDTLGRRDEALAALDPFFDDGITACVGGPGNVMTVGVELLLEAGRADDARRLYGQVYREGEASTEGFHIGILARCASVLACSGDTDAARRIALGVVAVLGRSGSPDHIMWTCARLARAFAPLPDADPTPFEGAIDELVGPPPGGWTVGSLRTALADRALDLAGQFDDRNGTRTTSDQIRAELDRGDLPPVSLRGTARSIDASPASEPLEVPAGEEAPAPAEPTRPAPAPSEGPAALDAWAREQFDHWRPDTCWDVLADRFRSEDDPTTAVVTLSWLLGTDHAPAVHTAGDLVIDERVDPLLRARLAAVLARFRADSGVADGVEPPADLALLLATGTGVDPVAAMRILRNVVEAALAVGDRALVDRALETALTLDLSVPLAGFLLDALRLVVANADRHGDPLGAAEADERAALMADDVLDAADEVLGDDPVSPLVVFALLDATSTLMDVGPSTPAPEPLERAVAGIPELVTTGPPRAQAELLLADVHLRLDGPAAAMAHQRRAISAIERHGPPGLVGWSRRGLAMQLQQVGRHDEALVQFAMAVDLLQSAGDIVNAWLVESARARCLLEADRVERAANVASDVIAQVDDAEDMPDDLRTMLLEPALEVAIEAESAMGGHRRASRLMERFAGLMVATGRSAVMASTAAALAAARDGDHERADLLMADAERTVADAPGPERDLDLALVATRRAELLWQQDRNEEAVEAAAGAEAAARAAGDDRLAAVAVSLAARARHDAFLRELFDDEPSAAALGAAAVDDLVRAIQVVQTVDMDDLAEHLGERLADLRAQLDDLGS